MEISTQGRTEMESTVANALPHVETDQDATAKQHVDFIVNTVTLPIVLGVGLVGNVLNIAVLWRSKRLIGSSFTYLRWLSITDLAVLLIKVIIYQLDFSSY